MCAANALCLESKAHVLGISGTSPPSWSYAKGKRELRPTSSRHGQPRNTCILIYQILFSCCLQTSSSHQFHLVVARFCFKSRLHCYFSTLGNFWLALHCPCPAPLFATLTTLNFKVAHPQVHPSPFQAGLPGPRYPPRKSATFVSPFSRQTIVTSPPRFVQTHFRILRYG